jgi:hypothetical protein
MIISIHQPQYLPWLPYFLKIEESDLFIFLDTVDFQKNGLQNRNQIKTAQGAHWLTVPVQQQLGQKIRDVKIDNRNNWRRKHWQTLQQCYQKAPAFKDYEKDIEALYMREWEDLSELNIELTTMMLRWMNIRTPIVRSSQMNATGTASELVLNICREAGATCYISGTGGANYLEPESFAEAGIEIVYRSSMLPEAYPQLFPKAGYINYLSALDILLNCGEAWRNYFPEEDAKS